MVRSTARSRMATLLLPRDGIDRGIVHKLSLTRDTINQGAVADMYKYRVELRTPLATAVEHRYYRETRRVEHIFTLDTRPGASVSDRPEVQITTQSEFVGVALDEKPVELEVQIR